MSSRSYAAHYLELPHAEPASHVELHAGDLDAPIWFELEPARVSARPGSISPPLRPEASTPLARVHAVAVMGRASITSARIQAVARVAPNYVEASPFRPGYPRRIKVIGPYITDGSSGVPITGLVDGDVIVYATNSAGYDAAGLALDGEIYDDWTYLGPNGPLGIISVINAANVTELIPVGTGQMISVAAVYRDVDSVQYADADGDPVSSGSAPQSSFFGARDGSTLAVRCAFFWGKHNEVPDLQWAESTPVVDGYVSGAPSYTYTAYVGIAEGRVYGPPAPEEPFIGVNPNPLNQYYQSMTACLVETTLAPQSPDPENYATTGVSRIPAG